MVKFIKSCCELIKDCFAKNDHVTIAGLFLAGSGQEKEALLNNSLFDYSNVQEIDENKMCGTCLLN